MGHLGPPLGRARSRAVGGRQRVGRVATQTETRGERCGSRGELHVDFLAFCTDVMPPARQLATGFLIDHPTVLLITPLILTLFSILSLPFLTLLLRLLLIGYYRHPRQHTYIWHVRPYAAWLIALVAGVWVWTWVVLRGIGRAVVAGVIGEWYFYRWVCRVRVMRSIGC